MTIKEFLDTKLEKGTHDVIFDHDNSFEKLDFDLNEVLEVKYVKIAIIKTKTTLL